MIKNIALLFSILITISLTSCEYDFDVNIPAERKLVPLCNFSPENPFVVFLSTNTSVSDTSARAFFPRNAQIKLYENDRFVEDLEFIDDFTNVVHYKSKMIPQASNKYSIRAYLDNYDSIYSENIIPDAIAISNVLLNSVNFKPEGTIEHWVNMEVEMNVQLDHPRIEEHYFHLRAKKNLSFIDHYTGDTLTFQGEILDIQVPDLTYEEMTHESGILFSGADLKDMGSRFDIITPFIFDTLNDVRSHIKLELRTVSEDYYRFHKSMSAQNILSFQQNLISNQAIRIYNNIENGIGNFSGYNTYIDSLRWFE